MNDKKNNYEFNGINTQILNTAFDSMRKLPERAKVTFSAKSEWNGGFSVTTTSKDFRMGGQNIERNTEYKMQYDYPNQFSGQGRGPTVCEACMGALGACLTQTIVGHATSRGIKIHSIDINVEGDLDMRGWTGISNDVRPGAQQLRVKMNIKSDIASKEQINELYEIGRRFSPAFDTINNGTSVVLVNS
jgi:uncharacterized OsmC-like protein